ncbi:hypothetical protein [Alteribacter natronophilus]|uniref:hypothetical protein n=1 Tax=Alteribacter natronophilus TaxID=2583810 RepID=UPI00110F06FA|nr:hypothetical protein [Alteribacter natronophilus]TMW72742.1 hypothetical protein FGB90_00050 [Alteribacter natronophilus]
MEQARVEFARTLYIERLDEPARSIFRFVEKRELILADEAVSENHYVQLLQNHSPIMEAAREFFMDPADVYDLVQKIEADLSDRLPDLIRGLTFTDYTDELRLRGLCSGEYTKVMLLNTEGKNAR